LIAPTGQERLANDSLSSSLLKENKDFPNFHKASNVSVRSAQIS
jgi:hypothetical protein